MKTRLGIDVRKVWEERKRGGRLPLHVMLRLKSRYLVDGAAIGSEEILRRLTGKAATVAEAVGLGIEEEGGGRAKKHGSVGNPAGEGARRHGESGVAGGKPRVVMRYGQWGGLRVLRDLRVDVVG